MRANHCYSFETELDMAEWSKGDIEVSLFHGGEVLTSRGFVSQTDAGRRTRYIVFVALTVVGLLACAAAILLLTRRIKTISDGRVDPASGMTQLTQRSRQNRP